MGKGAVPASGPAAAVLNEQTTWHISGAYALPFARLSAGYLDTRRDFAAIVDDHVTTWHAGASVPMGPGALLVQTATSRQAPSAGISTKRTTTTVGYDYILSKRTDVYLVAMHDRLERNASGTSVGLGLRHRF